ncbi:MAG: hypothetical protein KJO08_05430 [Gammaproteobacteria bacterium]|nr:hypothetical protein [Gammaproteobacteria bacterium]NNJ83367.1 hypothetical protein [Gammaproteobacteria bacterium]
MAKQQPKEFVEVGYEPAPGMRLRAICRGHTGTIGRIAWSPAGGSLLRLPMTIGVSTRLIEIL